MTDKQLRSALKSTTITDEMIAYLDVPERQKDQPTHTNSDAFAKQFNISKRASEAILQLWWERKL